MGVRSFKIGPGARFFISSGHVCYEVVLNGEKIKGAVISEPKTKELKIWLKKAIAGF